MSGLRFIETVPIEGLERPALPGMTIGRGPSDVELSDPDVSRSHAVLRQVDSGLAIEDVGSKNGTFVNGARVQGITELAPGDEVRFGNTVWLLDLRPAGDTEERSRTSTHPSYVRPVQE
jgi:pSer/pThr/pTyr-binding forkhead associated (FHA) protein